MYVDKILLTDIDFDWKSLKRGRLALWVMSGHKGCTFIPHLIACP